MSFVGKWVELDIILSEISQIQQDKYYMLSVLCGSYLYKEKNWKMEGTIWEEGGDWKE
jgi:hypothetical protein